MPPKKRLATKATPAAVKTKTGRSARRVSSDTIAARVNKDHGENTVVLASRVIIPDRLSTGSLAFNVAMTGGLPRNQWTEVIGNESSGKTTFVLKTLAEAQRKDSEYFCVWIASESFDPSQGEMCGVDMERIYLIEENVMEDAFQIAIEFIEGRGCDMLVIDSYPALVTVAEDGKEMGEYSPGRGAQVLNLFMRKCTKATKRALTNTDPEMDRPVTGIIVNQWREKIGVIKGDPRTTPGGKGKNFWMYARLDLRRDEWILNKQKEKVGQVIKLVVIKMKGARPQQIGVVDYYFVDYGEFSAGEYDTFKQIINLAIYFDVIERSGSGYKGPEGQHIKSQQLLIDTIASDIGWRDRIEKEVLAIAKRGKSPTEIDADVVDLHVVDDEEETQSHGPRRRRRTV
jgi:recombination protein RecA